MDKSSYSAKWTLDQNKAFETAMVDYYDEEEPAKWEKIAACVSGKTAEEIKRHYEILLGDIEAIEAGEVPLLKYTDAVKASAELSDDCGKKGGGKISKSEHERRKGIAWTEDEHRLFLLGLEKYGKGDWRSISRNFVVTRTPTQVASHAQKYFIRLNSMNKDRRRSSIHDITSIGGEDAPQGPITGEASAAAAVPAKPGNLSSGHPGAVALGSPAIGQPVSGPLIPAVGTPVSIPVPPSMAYGVRASVSGAVVPGTPVNAPSVNRSKRRASDHR